MENKIIIVSGCPAAGKSTFSINLSHYLSIPCFNKDTIKEVMGDGYGSESGEVFQKGSKVTFLLMLHIVERFLQVGKICIIESNFLHNDSVEIIKLLEKYNCKSLTFLFGGELDKISERYFDRDNKRHWVHGKAENKDSIKDYALKTKILEVTFGGELINVDATSFETIKFEQLFNKAKAFVDREKK